MRYKTAEQLKIQQWEYDGLLKTRELLASGHVKHVEKPGRGRDACSGTVRKKNARFDMARAIGKYDCGTAMCIGGYVSLFRRRKALPEVVSLNVNQIGAIETYIDSTFGPGANNATFPYRSGPVGHSRPLASLFFPSYKNWAKITPRVAAAAIDNFLETGRPKWRDAVKTAR